jgi:long-chain fatty acid transport protein
MSVIARRRQPHPLLCLVALGLWVVGAAPRIAHAGGIARPNIVGARAVGMGGAYVAVADDSLSIWHNPAGLARLHTADITLGTELVFILREYRPPGHDIEKASVAPNPLPMVMGGARMLIGRNSFLSLGAGLYNSYGGAVSFDKSKVTEGVLKTQVALFELAPTIAYQLSDKIFIGATIRLGMAFFNAQKGCQEAIVCQHNPPGGPDILTDVHTMTGAGVGYALGIQVLPVSWLGLGLTYRSNLTVTPSKKDAVESLGNSFDAKVRLPFPQSLAAGIFVRVHPRVLLAAQFDWVDNSALRQIYIDVDQWVYGLAAVNTQLNQKDSFAAHLGTEITVLRSLLLRAGMAWDSQSIPNRYRTRELEDANKLTWDLGATYKIGKWRIDLAAELMLGDVAEGFRSVVFPVGYASPGRHFPGGTFSLHLGAGVAW